MKHLSLSQLKWIKSISSKSKLKDGKHFIVEGDKIILEALSMPFIRIHHIYMTDTFLTMLNEKNIAVDPVLCTLITQSDLEKISLLKNPKHAFAIVDKHFPIMSNESKWLVSLDMVQDPGNLGTIIRTCDWFGIHRLILSDTCVYHFNPKVIQSAMGSIFRVRVEYKNLAQWLQTQQKEIFLTSLTGKNFRHQTYPADGGIIVLGNESKGISTSLLNTHSNHICIPSIASHAESLNVSVACGILLSHVVR